MNNNKKILDHNLITATLHMLIRKAMVIHHGSFQGLINGFKRNSVVPTHLSSADLRRQYRAVIGWIRS